MADVEAIHFTGFLSTAFRISRGRIPLLDEREVDCIPELPGEGESFIARQGLVG